jgi:hypothetical protein
MQLILADLGRGDRYDQRMHLSVFGANIEYQDSGSGSNDLGSAVRNTGLSLPLTQQREAIYSLNNPSIELIVTDPDAGRPQ